MVAQFVDAGSRLPTLTKDDSLNKVFVTLQLGRVLKREALAAVWGTSTHVFAL